VNVDYQVKQDPMERLGLLEDQDQLEKEVHGVNKVLRVRWDLLVQQVHLDLVGH
jgi:hypothetical protein